MSIDRSRATARARGVSRVAALAVVFVAVACSATTSSTSSAPPSAGSSPTSAGVTNGSGVKRSTTTRPATSAHATDDPAVVATDKGSIRGSVLGGSRAFVGVPFAAPPVGDLRWKMPQPHAPWSDVRDANAPGQLCAQIGFATTKPGGTEDCLYLNVYAPTNVKAGAPVMVWFHGGGFALGSPGFTNGATLAEKYGVVVVAPAYRLGPFGFLASDDLAKEDPNGSTGSYGIADQQLALEWVQDNAAAFGGDRDNVTIFGESAGGMSVCDHLISPRSAGLFVKAIVESGPCATPIATKADAEKQGAAMAQALGCTGAAPLTCLRSKSADDLLNALPNDGVFGLNGGTRWGPTVDGYVLTGQTTEVVASGGYNRVPTIFGWNADEGKLFNGLAYILPGKPLSAADYPAAIARFAGGDTAKAQKVVDQYPAAKYPTPGDAYAAAVGDAALKCAGRSVAVAMAAQNPVWVYSFAYPDSSFQVPIPGYALGAFHSAEIQFAFDTPLKADDPVEQKLGDEMSKRWAAFAKSGDPSAGLTPAWAPITDQESHIVFDRTVSTGGALDKDVCAFWDGLGIFKTNS